MNSIEIIEILHSIKDLKFSPDGNLLVKFDDQEHIFPDGWEPVAGYVYGSFTEQLLLLIEDALQGKLPTNSIPSPNGEQPTT